MIEEKKPIHSLYLTHTLKSHFKYKFLIKTTNRFNIYT